MTGSNVQARPRVLALETLMAILICVIVAAAYLLREKARIDSVLAEKALRNNADELSKAPTRAEAANCAKSKFLATVSHELRTPLNAIIGFSDIF